MPTKLLRYETSNNLSGDRNTFLRGLTRLILPSDPLTPASGGTEKATRSGLGLTSSTGFGFRVGTNRIQAGLDYSTTVVLFNNDNSTSEVSRGRTLYCERSEEVQIYKIVAPTPSTLSFVFRNSLNQLINQPTTSVTVNANYDLHVGALVTKGSNFRRIWCDGNGSTNTTDYSNSFTTANDVRICGDIRDSTSFYNGSVIAVALFNIALTDEQLDVIRENPNILFERKYRYTPVVVSSGGYFVNSTGSLSSYGSCNKSSTKIFNGAATLNGASAKAPSKILGGNLSISGLLTRVASKLSSGYCAFSGHTTKLVNKFREGFIGLSGTVTKFTSHFYSGSLSFSGFASKAMSLLVITFGGLGFSGAVFKSARKKADGNLNTSATIAKHTSKLLTASMSLSGRVLKLSRKATSGGIGFIGALISRIVGLITGSVNRTYSVPIEQRAFKIQAEKRSVSVSDK